MKKVNGFNGFTDHLLLVVNAQQWGIIFHNAVKWSESGIRLFSNTFKTTF